MADLWNSVSSPITAQAKPQADSSWDTVSSPITPPKQEPEAQGRLIDGTPISGNPEDRSLLDKINRQVQLAGRIGVEGMMTLPSIPGAVANLTRAGGDYLLGIPPSSGPVSTPMEQASRGMDAIGMPKPEGWGERLEGDVLRAVSGAQTMGANPLATTSAATGGLTGGSARELGYSPGVQLAAGLTGSMVGGPLLYNGVQSAYGAIQPLLDSGRKQLADSLLAKYADNPQAAAAALSSAPQYVPGSVPIAGEASNDTGLLGLQKTLQQQPDNYFGQRLSDQNTARASAINQVTGNESTIPRYQDMRTQATRPLYEQSAPQPVNPQAIAPVIQEIDKQVTALGPGSDAGKTLLGMKSDIQRALPDIKQVPTGLLDANGNPIINTVVTPKPQSNLIQIYRETRDALSKSAMQPGAYGSTVKDVIAPINQKLGQALESQSPDFAQAQDLYGRMSTPINQTANMQELAKRLVTTQHDLQGNNMLSPAASERILNAGEMNTPAGVTPLAEALSPEQYQSIQAVNNDLARSNMVNSPIIRPPGSNTFNNAASTGQLADNLGARIAEKIPFIGPVYRDAKQDIIRKLADTMLSPPQAAQVLMHAKPQMTFGQNLLAQLLASGQGAAIAGVSNGQRQ